MTSQPGLFDIDQADNYTRPAHIDPNICGTSGTNYVRGCRCEPCRTRWNTYYRNLQRGIRQQPRTCKQCGQEYTYNRNDETGTKYCSTQCKLDGYSKGDPRLFESKKHNVTCLTCGTSEHHKGSTRAAAFQMCSTCLHQLRALNAVDALAKHHAPPAIAHAYLADPNCQVCKVPLGKTIVKNSKNQWRHNIAIDHDHNCCPKSQSCGQCIRGWLCQNCNHALGQVKDNPATLRSLADYLDKWADQ